MRPRTVPRKACSLLFLTAVISWSLNGVSTSARRKLIAQALSPQATAISYTRSPVAYSRPPSSSQRSTSAWLAARRRGVTKRHLFLLSNPGEAAIGGSAGAARRPNLPRARRRAHPSNSTRRSFGSVHFNDIVEVDETLDRLLRRKWQSWYTPEQGTKLAVSSASPSGGARSSIVLSPGVPPTMSDTGGSRKNQVLALLWAIACVSALDRVAMSIALLPMGVEFDLTDTVKGGLSSYFSLGYGIGIVPAGLLVSRFSPKAVMAVGLALWSLATLATPLAAASASSGASSLAEFPLHLLMVRAAVGMGESVILPAVQRLLTQWISGEDKAAALATIISGFHVGTLAAYVLSPIVLEHTHSWRGLFEVYGGLGLLLLVPWWGLAADSPSEQQATDLSRALYGPSSVGTSMASLRPSMLTSCSYLWTTPVPTSSTSLRSMWDSVVETGRKAPWEELRTSKATWGLLLAHCAKNWGLYNALAWTPTFFAEQYDLSIRDSAMFSILPSITGAICVLGIGKIADGIGKGLHGKSIARGNYLGAESSRASLRKAFQLVAFGGQGLALAALARDIPEQAAVAQGFLMASYGFAALSAAGFESGVQEKAGERWAGLLYSVTSLPAVLFGTAGVYVTGRILDLTHQDWSNVFGVNSVICFLGAAAFVALYDSKKEFE